MIDEKLLLPDEWRPQRADAVKNRALLLETAKRLFCEHGIENVSMSAIAEAAGVGKGTLYRHFTGKDELAHALLDHEARELQNRTLARLRSNGDPLDDLHWLIDEIAHYIDRHLDVLHLAAPLNHPAHIWWRQMFIELLRRIELPAGADVEYAADMLHIMLDVQTIHFQRQQLGYSLNRIINGLQFLLNQLVS